MTATRRTRPDREPTAEQTIGDVDHTHPYTDRGAINRPFERGPVVAADGGEREAYESEEDAERAEDESAPKMKDVNHTPPDGSEGANRVFERGGKEEPVEPVEFEE